MLDIAAVCDFIPFKAAVKHTNQVTVAVNDRRSTLPTKANRLQLKLVVIRHLAQCSGVHRWVDFRAIASLKAYLHSAWISDDA